MAKPKIYKLKKFINKTGKLLPINFNSKFPFKVKRVFFLYGKKKYSRGDHAHKKCSQFFVPVFGKCKISLKYKKISQKFILNHKQSTSLLVPPKIWCRVNFLSRKTIIMVICDYEYNFNDYIETYKNFTKFENKI